MIAVTLSDIPADGREPENAPVLNQRTVLVPQAEWNMPWTECRTFPKNDQYQVLDADPSH
jgi:hypothetical protein